MRGCWIFIFQKEPTVELKNKVALIAGGARMGEETACMLARKGCRIVFTYRNSGRNAELAAKKVRSLQSETLLVKADLSRRQDVVRLMEQIRRKFGRLDIVVNMASIYEKRELAKLRPADLEDNLGCNLESAYWLSLEAFRLMKKSGSGRIIHFADWTARSGRPRYKGYIPYYISKAGILGLTEVLALEFAPRVLVNAIAPGPILPPEGSTAREIKAVIQSTPLKKWGGAAEIAKTVFFLVQTEFITGECIRVDGGRHLY